MQEDVGRFDAAIFNVKAAFSIDDPRITNNTITALANCPAS